MLNTRHPGLEAVIQQGARRHHRHYGRMFRSVFPAAASTAAANAALYALILATAGRTDWGNIIVGASGTAAIPIVAISLLLIMTPRDHPVTLALAATTMLGPFWLLINYLAFAGTFVFVFHRGGEGAQTTRPMWRSACSSGSTSWRRSP